MTRFRSGLETFPIALITSGAVALLCVTLWAPNAQAYPSYDNGAGVGCVQCHSGFQNGNGALHNQHRTGFGIGGGTDCNLCHPSGGGSTPVLTYESGTTTGYPGGGLGCAGCHGRDYGEISSSSGNPKASGWGLRRHHANNGEHSCEGCHGMPTTIFGENVAPPYYGLSSNNLTDPCSSAEEDLAFDDLQESMDMVGLDNDGDGLIDFPDDPDCSAPTTTTTTLPPGSGGYGITGKKLVIVDKITAAGKAKIVYVAKDLPADKGTTNDPAQISATLDYQSSTLGASGSAAMPQGAGWLVNKPTVAKYVNKDAPGGAGAVKVAVIKPQKLLKAVLKDLGDTGSKIDIYGTGDPAPSAVDVTTQYTVTDGALIRRHCGEFTACARKIIGAGSGAKVVCKNATPGASVTCPGSPSGAFLN